MSTEIERIAAATAILAQHGVPADVQELLLRGDGRGSVPPGVLANILATARAEDRNEGLMFAVEYLRRCADAADETAALAGRNLAVDRGKWARAIAADLESEATAIRALMEKE